MHTTCKNRRDKLFGGAGEDGAVGDDGKVLTTRNGLTEALYGLTTPNAQALLSSPDVDGALVGGASLSPDGFLSIAAAARP